MILDTNWIQRCDDVPNCYSRHERYYQKPWQFGKDFI